MCNLMMNWKDQSEFIFESGDHNCTHRLIDSLHNSVQHLQSGLVKHMKIHGLKDDFISVHGEDTVMYSRITATSKTRIDYILSNSNSCSYFQYIDMQLGLDHCAIFARYDISISVRKKIIPKDKYFAGWVISKCLEFDEVFLVNCNGIFQSVTEELMSNNDKTLDPSFFWLKAKTAIVDLAKKREKELVKIENRKIDVLKGFYFSALTDIRNGLDCFQEIESIKSELETIYQEKSKRKIDKMRGQEIDDHLYDIHKLQNQRRFEHQSKIQEISIGGNIYSGTENVISAIEEKMRMELKSHSDIKLNAPPTQDEEMFLGKIPKVELTEEERNELLCPVKESEITYILENEIDKDSSPGEDGITYRFISVFWKWPDFRFLYLKYLNFTREDGSMGLIENFGVMTIKNKKMQSNLYEKKRKLTKVNKESNLGNGKVWTNRFKNLILPKILPKTQFNCQPDQNIIDELREIRDVNLHLLGEGIDYQVDGTILSIDFKDAFRSVSHRWVNLVMKRLAVPQSFIDWFWMMYKDLYVVIVLSKYRSNKIYVERGFMEGHPPSMAAFVVSMIPLMYATEEKMAGIVTPNGKKT